ncbi:MAG TPA: hypothetical protein VFY75_03015 [Solirubrobacterales bacterium]|nr:hypothetical protein [Solirubrobacterales bacterium]
MSLGKLFSVVVVSAVVMGVTAGSAHATVLTNFTGSTYTGSVSLRENFYIEIHGEGFTTVCSSSNIGGSVTQHGAGVTAQISISTLDFSECNYPVTVLSKGSLEIHATSGGNGTVTSNGMSITVHGPFGINCMYQTSNTDIGTLTGTYNFQAVIDADGALVPRTGDSIFCGSYGELTRGWKFSTPWSIVVD